MSSWHNDVIIEFLELYKSEPILWDPRHPFHRNRSEITEAWIRIQSAINISCSLVDLKKKKESLMTSFRMHWNKKKRTPGEYHTTWFAYPLMESFLGEVYASDTTNKLEEKAGYEADAAVSDHRYTGGGPGAGRRNGNVIETNTTKTRPSTSQPNLDKADFLYAKKQINEAVTYLKTAAAGDQQPRDEYDLYGELLVKKLRKLDEHQRDVAMHEIDNIMFRSKMQSSKQRRSYSKSPSPVPRKMKSPLFIVTQEEHPQYEDESVYQHDPMQTQHSSSN